jgi:predicted CXXCH cytochrome family protein
MGWRRAALGAPVAAAALLSAAGASAPALPDEVCELSGAHRARTPSIRCVACHDGTSAVGVVIGLGGGSHGDHPVEVDYAASAARDPERYVPPAMLRPDVPLVDGKVACTSCHDGASTHPKRAVDPANLCTACHRM